MMKKKTKYINIILILVMIIFINFNFFGQFENWFIKILLFLFKIFKILIQISLLLITKNFFEYILKYLKINDSNIIYVINFSISIFLSIFFIILKIFFSFINNNINNKFLLYIQNLLLSIICLFLFPIFFINTSNLFFIIIENVINVTFVEQKSIDNIILKECFNINKNYNQFDISYEIIIKNKKNFSIFLSFIMLIILFKTIFMINIFLLSQSFEIIILFFISPLAISSFNVNKTITKKWFLMFLSKFCILFFFYILFYIFITCILKLFQLNWNIFNTQNNFYYKIVFKVLLFFTIDNLFLKLIKKINFIFFAHKSSNKILFQQYKKFLSINKKVIWKK